MGSTERSPKPFKTRRIERESPPIISSTEIVILERPDLAGKITIYKDSEKRAVRVDGPTILDRLGRK